MPILPTVAVVVVVLHPRPCRVVVVAALDEARVLAPLVVHVAVVPLALHPPQGSFRLQLLLVTRGAVVVIVVINLRSTIRVRAQGRIRQRMQPPPIDSLGRSGPHELRRRDLRDVAIGSRRRGVQIRPPGGGLIEI